MQERDLIRTGEAARILGCSRQHIVDLCDEGKLAFQTTGVHRRIRRADVEARSAAEAPRREHLRALWLGRVIAGRIALDPQSALAKARWNLEHYRRIHAGSSTVRWLDEWSRVLDQGPDEVMRVLTAETPYARDLRQNSPFAGILSPHERAAVLTAFQRWWGRRA